MTATSNCAAPAGRRDSVAKMRERFDFAEGISEARERSTPNLTHLLALGSVDLIDRLEVVGDAIDMALRHMNNTTDATDEDAVRSILELVSCYRTQTANKAFELCASMVVALERGNLIAAPVAEVEAAHE